MKVMNQWIDLRSRENLLHYHPYIVHPCLIIINQSSIFHYMIILQFEGEITTTTSTTTSTTTTITNKVVYCGSGWTPHKEKCYRLFPTPLSWTSASAQCEANSGHLASVPDRETEEFLVGLPKNFSSPFARRSFWIGGYREGGDEVWQWHDGSPWNYTNWDKFEPNNAYGIEHHLELKWDPSGWNCWEQDHCWNDEHDENSIGYICQNGGE